MCIEFKDVYPGYTSSGFACTNELPKVFVSLLKKQRLADTLAIASAGEISLFVLLPKVRGKLVCVDHSYRSLMVFYIKALMLKELGSVETKKILSSGDPKLVQSTAATFVPQLPNNLRDVYTKMVEKTLTEYRWCETPFQDHVIRGDLKARWTEVSTKVLDVSRRKLDRIILIHGDIRDAFEHGPFTHAYLSNALEHLSRDKGYLAAKAKTLYEGLGNATLITTSSQGKITPIQWKTETTRYVTGSSPYWNYNILKPVIVDKPASQEISASVASW